MSVACTCCGTQVETGETCKVDGVVAPGVAKPLPVEAEVKESVIEPPAAPVPKKRR